MKTRLSRTAFEATIVAAVLALAACSPEPYPSPASEPPPPPPPVSDLAGGPPPSPPISYQQAPDASYPSAPASAAPSVPVVIAMAPIPNPPERSRAEHRVAPSLAPARPVQHRAAPPPAARAQVRAAPRPAARPVARLAPYQTGVVAPKPAAKAAAPAPRLAPKPAVHLAPAPKLTRPAPPKLAAAPVLTAPPATTAAPPVVRNAEDASPLGDRATRLAALESALAEAVSKTAALKTPASYTAGKPVEVTLTLPAGFAQTVRDEAAKAGLSAAVTSMNMIAMVSGDGFAVTPDTVQSQPLVPGKPVEFKWSVTGNAGAKGPLHADLGADLLGAGSDVLNLGLVEPVATFGFGTLSGGRLIGIGILVVLAAVVLAWLARGGRQPLKAMIARNEAARRRAAAASARDQEAT